MQTVYYSYTCCDIVESVCLSVYALVTRLSEPSKNGSTHSCSKVRGFYVMVIGLGSRGVPRPLSQYGGLGALPPPQKNGNMTFISVNFGAAF